MHSLSRVLEPGARPLAVAVTVLALSLPGWAATDSQSDSSQPSPPDSAAKVKVIEHPPSAAAKKHAAAAQAVPAGKPHATGAGTGAAPAAPGSKSAPPIANAIWSDKAHAAVKAGPAPKSA